MTSPDRADQLSAPRASLHQAGLFGLSRPFPFLDFFERQAFCQSQRPFSFLVDGFLFDVVRVTNLDWRRVALPLLDPSRSRPHRGRWKKFTLEPKVQSDLHLQPHSGKDYSGLVQLIFDRVDSGWAGCSTLLICSHVIIGVPSMRRGALMPRARSIQRIWAAPCLSPPVSSTSSSLDNIDIRSSRLLCRYVVCCLICWNTLQRIQQSL